VNRYFSLKEVPPPTGEFFMTAAILDCALCGSVINGMGGGPTAICERCADALNSGRLKGSVKHPGDTANR
jgi:hypothetical protein